MTVVEVLVELIEEVVDTVVDGGTVVVEVAPTVVLVVVVLVETTVVVVGAVVVVIGGAVLVVVLDVVVVVTQPPSPQASQQLEKAPTHALPPAGGVHAPALRLRVQRVIPLRVRQQVTKPERPHTARLAQRVTSRRHAGVRSPSWTRWIATPTAQRT